jgi:hypothetical protein
MSHYAVFKPVTDVPIIVQPVQINWFQKMVDYLNIKDTQDFIPFPTQDYNQIIKFCFYCEQRPLSENTFKFLQERPIPYIVDGLIRVDNLQFFITYVDGWRMMIHKLGYFYFKKDKNDNFLLSDLYLSSVSAEERLTNQNLPLHHFILRGSHTQLYKLAVTYVSIEKESGKKCVKNVLIGSVPDGWSISEEGKLLPEVYPTLEELIMKCKVFMCFCFDNTSFSKDEM